MRLMQKLQKILKAGPRNQVKNEMAGRRRSTEKVSCRETGLRDKTRGGGEVLRASDKQTKQR